MKGGQSFISNEKRDPPHNLFRKRTNDQQSYTRVGNVSEADFLRNINTRIG